MNNFDVARQALEVSLNSSGSAMREHAKWSESLEARLNKLKAAWQSLSQAFMSSDFLKGALDGVIGLVDGLTKLIDTFGAIPTLLTGFAIFKSFGNKGIFKTFNNDLDGFINKIGIANKSFAELANVFNSANTGGFKGFISGLKSMGDALANPLSQSDLSAIESYNKLIDDGVSSQEAFAQTMKGTSNAAQGLVQSANGGKVALNGMKTASLGAKVGLIGAKVAAVAFNAALTMGISLLIDWAVSGIQKLINAKKDLAEEVDEITSKFKEQSEELKKLQGDYDTDNESSMINKYERLSKGVDNLGRNVSLTAEEYSEYQSIVNQIADQIPSLVSGYDEQGNAILSCKDNIELLIDAYENLIKVQNDEILVNNYGDIIKDFENSVKSVNQEKLFDFEDFFNENLSINSANVLQGLLDSNYRTKEDVEGYLEDANITVESMNEIKNILEDAGADVHWYTPTWSIYEKLAEMLTKNPDKIKSAIDKFRVDLDVLVEGMDSAAQATLSKAFDFRNSKYADMSDNMQSLVRHIVGEFDFGFYSELLENEKYKGDIEKYINDMLDSFKNMADEDAATLEAVFDLKTQFNGGDISYGEYVDGLENAGKLIHKLNLDKEIESQLKLSLGLDEKGFVTEFEKLKNRLASNEYFDIMPSDYVPFIEGLSSEELSVIWQIIPELEATDYKEDIADIKAALEKEMMLQGLTFDLNIEVEAAGLESLNTALAESVSATGLSSESITALKGRYADLESQGYDLSSMFEETSTGIRLNRQEFNKLEKAYATKKLSKIDGELAEMKSAYDDLGEAIKNCDDPIKKSELFNDRQTLAKKISEAATLAAQYEGLTNAYNDWLSAEEAGQERDMYENIISGFETVDDEISRGWIDDGAIEFLELLTGRTDLAGKSGKQLKEVYDSLDDTIKNTTYSIRDFFTVDEDGNSTNAGVYNFLDAIGQLEEEKFGGKDVVQRDEDGNIIGFDFKIAGGDEAIADALSISKELVQIMVRAADDAGFVISMDGAYRQLADLQNEAKAAADYLHEIGKTDFEFDFNTTSVSNLKTQLEEAHKILDSKEFWNKDGTFNFNADGATEAMQVVSTLQAKLDKLTEDKYGIGLTVEDEKFEEPLEKLQEYGRNVATLNQLKLNPKANSEEIDELNGELDTIAQELIDLSKNNNIDIGIDANDNIEDVKKKIENGEIKIPTVLDIQANMDKNIETLADLALLNSGLLSEDEEEVIKKKYSVDVKMEANEVDTSDVDNKVDGALNGDTSIRTSSSGTTYGGTSKKITRETAIEIIAETVGIEDVDGLTSKLKGLDDKTVEAVAKVIGQTNVDLLSNTIAKLKPNEVEAIAKAIGQGDVDALKTAINQLDPAYVEAIANAFGYDEVSDLNTAIEDLDPKTVQAVAQALGITDVEGLKTAIDNVKGKDVEVNASTSGESKLGFLKSLIDSIKSKTVTITSWFKKITSGGSTRNDSNGFNDVDGTANVDGTTGRAFKQGSWSTKNSGTALVGELGREVLVRNGRYYTIGDNGAEFIKYQRGDIIFNHRQTEELFKNGRVTSGGGRGKAFSSGTAFSDGSGGIGRAQTKTTTETKTEKKADETKTTTTTKTTTSSTGGSSGGGGVGKVEGSSVGSDKDNEEAAKEFEETFDWIEVAISRIEREINNLDRTTNSVYKSWGERNKALSGEISKVSEEIRLQNDAASKYLKEANSVGLTEVDKSGRSYAEMVREGTLDISTLNEKNSSEELIEKIKNYQKWYELYLDCTDAAEELKEKESELYAQRFENIQTQYESILQGFEHTESMLNEYINQAEAKGQILSKEYYNALISNEENRIAQLKKEQYALIRARDEAVASGTIAKYSEEWYGMCQEIDGVTQALEESTTKIIEFNNAIRDIDWQIFDLIQERISDITAESDFFIELMSNKKLFDDKGKLTDQGLATIGLHAQNYNTHMYQADNYGEEAAKIDAQLAMGYDENLEERRRELIELQRESILAAEGEKQAIKDLVEEGFNAELDSLQEIIDKKNEALESEKD